MADQTFVIYRMEVTAAHGKPIIIPLKQWRHDLQAMAEAITDRTRLLFLCNPNNPTGTMVSADEVESLLSRVPGHVIVVFDEAYFEYVRNQQFPDSMAYVKQGRNVIALRTFSKIYGLAGLRIGYGVAPTEITNFLNRVRPPFNANSLAQRAALAALGDDEHVARSRAVNAAGMEQMVKGLTCARVCSGPERSEFCVCRCRTRWSRGV